MVLHFALCSFRLAHPLGAAASESSADRIPNGCLPSANPARNEAFRQGLRELGYVEEKNIVIEWRFAEGKLDRLPALAAELVRLKVDVIVTGGSGDIQCSQGSDRYNSHCHGLQDGDPVGNGFVASLARPGGNITGLSTLRPELSGKQLELLKEIVPKLSRVAFFASFNQPGQRTIVKRGELAAGALGVKLQYLDIEVPRILRPHFEPQQGAC